MASQRGSVTTLWDPLDPARAALGWEEVRICWESAWNMAFAPLLRLEAFTTNLASRPRLALRVLLSNPNGAPSVASHWQPSWPAPGWFACGGPGRAKPRGTLDATLAFFHAAPSAPVRLRGAM